MVQFARNFIESNPGILGAFLVGTRNAELILRKNSGTLLLNEGGDRLKRIRIK